MNNIKVSVIIPVYNVESYLKECLDSVINQTLKEIEIICIDDYSTDNSYKILEEYSNKDNRIIIIKNKENIGVGISRNNGINIAKGEYIGFVDADDYISNNYFELLYNTAKKYNSDISYTLNLYRDDNGKICTHNVNIYNYLSENEKKNIDLYIEGINSINIINQKYGTKEYSFDVVWNKIFKKTFILNNNLYFMEIKARAGDADFFYRVLFNEPKTSFNHNPIYYYRLNQNSIVNSAKLEDNIKAIKHFENSINYYKERGNDLYLKYLYSILLNNIICYFKILNFNKEFYNYISNFINKIEIDKEITQEYLYKEYLLIKSNDTYEKYLLQKNLFEQIKLLDNKINKIIRKQNSKIKLFGIEKFNDRMIIYLFGIKITIKK